jgi:hypothetical protein
MPKNSSSALSGVAFSQVLKPPPPAIPQTGQPPQLVPTKGNNNLNPSPLPSRLLSLNKRHTWRWKAAAFCWLLLVVSLAGLAISAYVVNDRLQNFEQIGRVAVPSINAANQAEQSLATEVSANASFILSDAATRQTLLAQIERNRAEFERALQTGYSAISTYRNTNPSIDTAYDYLNQYNQALQDAFAQARSLTVAGNQTEAVKTYLEGQNTYYKPIIFTLYYLRSIYINRLDQAREAASNANTLQLILACAVVLATAGLLFFISLWLTLKVKRVFIPLVNLGFILAAAYSAFLVLTLLSSSSDLNKIVTAYDQTSLLSDSQRLLTDAASDQVQWLISGNVDASGKFNGDQVYAVDFKTQTERLLAIPANAQAAQQCPATDSARTSYPLEGEMASVCRNLLSNAQLTNWNKFYSVYLAWLNDDAKFRQLATTSKVSDALTYLNTNSLTNFNQLSASLAQLRADNEQIYTNSSTNARNQLDLLSNLTWVVFPLSLVLGVFGLLRWRREF